MAAARPWSLCAVADNPASGGENRPHPPDQIGNSPFAFPGIAGDHHRPLQQIVDLLVKAGADVNLADGTGVTPLQHARAAGYKEIETLLLAVKAR
jgi:ankyrin repeat protein